MLQVELKITNGVNDFEECEKYPLQLLKEKDPEKLPLNVDATNKEVSFCNFYSYSADYGFFIYKTDCCSMT